MLMKRQASAAGVLLLLGFLFALVWDSYSNKEGSEAEYPKRNGPQKAANYESMRRPDSNFEQSSGSGRAKRRFYRDYEPIEKFTFWLMLATLGLVAVGGLQVWSFVESERAALTINLTGIEGEKLAVGKPIVVQVSIENSGKGIAFFQDGAVDTRTSQLIPEKPQYLMGTFDVQGPIAAGATVSGTVAVKNHLGNIAILTQPVVDDLNGGAHTAFAYGYIRYNDGFSKLPFFGSKAIYFCGRMVTNGGLAPVTFNGCGNPAYVHD
jgi:hypothetical protein